MGKGEESGRGEGMRERAYEDPSYPDFEEVQVGGEEREVGHVVWIVRLLTSWWLGELYVVV